MNREIDLTLDIAKSAGHKPEVVATLQQGESESLTINAAIVVDSEPLDLTGCSVSFLCRKPDQTAVMADARVVSAEGGAVAFDVPKSVAASAGQIALAYFSVSRGDEWTATTECFALKVNQGVDADSVASSDDYQTIAELLAEIRETKAAYDQAVSAARDAAEKADGSAEKASEVARSLADGYKAAEAARNASYGEAEGARDTAYATAENDRDSRFAKALEEYEERYDASAIVGSISASEFYIDDDGSMSVAANCEFRLTEAGDLEVVA